ncbi:MAG: preprotein translocase subunit SecE [Planctomycetota bacterium]|jgi:preprotein translocase SecE subunit|nr:preprotein translocase subunit SecE [Planctomycetota bacterium]
MELYKPGQGMVVRRLLLLTILGIGLFMSVSMWSWMVAAAGSAEATLLWMPAEWLGQSLVGEGTFLGFEVTPALLISIVVFGLVVFLATFYTFQKTSTGEFLIETDKEMRKVSWPTWGELRGSSVVVVIVTVFLGVYLYVIDQVLARVMYFLTNLGGSA